MDFIARLREQTRNPFLVREQYYRAILFLIHFSVKIKYAPRNGTFPLLNLKIWLGLVLMSLYSCAQNKPIGSHSMKQNADFQEGISQA